MKTKNRSGLLACCVWMALGAAHAESTASAQPLNEALSAFAKQRGLQLIYVSDDAAGQLAQPVPDGLGAAKALQLMLKGTGLEYEFINDRTVRIYVTRARAAETDRTSGLHSQGTKFMRVAALDTATDKESSEGKPFVEGGKTEDVRAIAEVLVQGSRILNMDIRRTRDDVQPYVTFDRETIERSGATDLNDFFKQRLTMNTVGSSNVQQAGSQLTGAQGAINLRGMGTNKTLILIDGRRVSAPTFNNNEAQANINMIPLGAVERVEVLPATSAGIYGGAATGGVVNIILKRDYTGLDARLSYDNTFDTDSAMKRAELAGGWSSASGRTNVTAFASMTDNDGMLTSDRDFLKRARERILQNNPAAAYNLTSPPVGTTTNIASANGQNLVLRDGTALNSRFTYAPSGYAGAASDGGAALVANAGEYNFELPPTGQTAQTPTATGNERSLLQAYELNSAMLTLRHSFTDRLEGYLSGMMSEQLGGSRLSGVSGLFTLAAGAPTNPFQQAIVVRVPGSEELVSTTTNKNVSQTLNAGLIARLPNDLAISLDYGWSRAKLNFDYPRGFINTAGMTAVTSGAIDVLRDPRAYAVDFSPYLDASQYSVEPFKSTIQNGSLRFSKPLWELPAGSLTVAGLIERRKEEMDQAAYYQADRASQIVYVFPDRSQTITSAYLETTVPLVSARNRKPLLESWQMQLALRRDEYEVHGSTSYYSQESPPADIARATKKVSSTDFTVGTMYSPLQSLALRASYGTGFMPPSVTQLAPGVPGLITAGWGIVDPRRGNEAVTATYTTGGSTGLDSEESRSFSAGLVFSPSDTDLRLSLDYVIAEQKGLIGFPPGETQGFIQYEDLFPGHVVRAAPEAGDPFGVGRITNVDVTYVNLGQVDVEAFDAALDWSTTQLPLGRWSFSLAGTLQTKYDVQLVEGGAFSDYVGVSASNPLRFKGNASVTWSREGWSVSWSSRYFDSYVTADPKLSANATHLRTQGNNGHVPSQLYHDLVLRHSFDMTTVVGRQAAGFFKDLEVQLGVRNVFNTAPPFDAYAYSAGYYSPYGDPRLASYWLSVRASL